MDSSACVESLDLHTHPCSKVLWLMTVGQMGLKLVVFVVQEQEQDFQEHD